MALAESVYRDFLMHLLAGHKLECTRLVERLLASPMSLKDIYEKLFRRALYEIGELWERHKISVATEHLASAVVETLLNHVYASLVDNPGSSRTLLATCIEGEQHQIGIKMVADVFELHGWNVQFLGANTPRADFLAFVRDQKPDMVAISVSLSQNFPNLEALLASFRTEFPTVPVMVGGQAFEHGGKEILIAHERLLYFPDLPTLEVFLAGSVGEKS